MKMGEVSRRSFICGSAALAAAATAPAAFVAANNDLHAAASAGPLAEMAREVRTTMDRWNVALAEHNRADAALHGCQVGLDRAAVKAWEARTNEAAGALADEVDELAFRLVDVPAQGLADLVCKAQVAMLTGTDGLAELIVRELAAMGGANG